MSYPTNYQDRYQNALRELIEGKFKGLAVKPREIAASVDIARSIASCSQSKSSIGPQSSVGCCRSGV
jgi:hypothetical protein